MEVKYSETALESKSINEVRKRNALSDIAELILNPPIKLTTKIAPNPSPTKKFGVRVFDNFVKLFKCVNIFCIFFFYLIIKIIFAKD